MPWFEAGIGYRSAPTPSSPSCSSKPTASTKSGRKPNGLRLRTVQHKRQGFDYAEVFTVGQADEPAHGSIAAVWRHTLEDGWF